MLRKGISPIISTVLIVLMVVSAVAIVLLIGTPAIERARESAIINEGMQNMKIISNTINGVASEGSGSMQSLQIKVSGGEYKINGKANSIDFTYAIKSDIIQPGSFIKDGDVIMSAGANAKGSVYDLDGDGNDELVLENEILRIGILKNGTQSNPSIINTSKLIKVLNFKDTNSIVIPYDSSIFIDDNNESSYGIGYSEIVKIGDHLTKAEAVVHIDSNHIAYDVLYTLQSGSDFLTAKIINAYYK